MSYKEKYSFEERCERSKLMREKYPSKIPVVLTAEKTIELKSSQFLVSSDLSFAQFICMVRKNYTTSLRSHEAIFCMVNRCLPPNTSLLSQIYQEHSEADGILYINITKESTFG